MGAAKIIRLPGTDPTAERESLDAQEHIEDYLDHLCAPLVGIVPYRERDRLRQEAVFNIEGRMRQFLVDGYDSETSVFKAIEKYGRAEELSEKFLEEWLRYQPKGALARMIGLPNAYATFFFGQATLWGILLVQYRVFSPEPEPFTFGLTLADIRRIIPEPLPLPDRNPWWTIFWLYAILAPFVAGWLTGRKVLIGAGKAVYQVQLLATLMTFSVGAIMLPTTEGIWLAMIQVLWWVPVGTLIAHTVSALTRRRRLCFRPQKETRRKHL